MKLTIEQMEADLTERAEGDELYAEAKTEVLRREIFAKRVRARVFVTEDGSVDARKAKAEGHADVEAADEMLIDATADFERLKARRETLDIRIESTRTVEASRRKG